MRLIHIILISTLLAPGAVALEDESRPVSPLLEWNAGALERFDPSWLHVKFVEGSDVHLIFSPTASDLRFTHSDGSEYVEVNRVLASALTLRRTFPGNREMFRAWKTRGEAASGRLGPDLSLWYDVKFVADRASLAGTLNALNALPVVEIAHPAPICEVASITTTSPALHECATKAGETPDFTELQEYLFETPVGLDAPSAWAITGGRGAGGKFIDVELGWTHNHEDFNQANLFYQGKRNSSNSSYYNHGTAVMGEVVGVDNTFGITGFASDAQWGTVGIDINDWPIVPHSFLEAVKALDPGDVWLIELQMFPTGRSATPMEWVQVNYDVIWTSSWALDVVCIEAGANGSQDLDASIWEGVFDRNIRDSGAIMVGAGTPYGRSAEGFTNYGSRMDVNGWGSQIVTTGYGDLYDEGPRETEYTDGFGGTSGASPMVAGSALCLQGIARANLGSPLSPVELRWLLHDTGIDHLGTRLIGPRPDLGAAVDQLLNSQSANLTGFAVVVGSLLDGDLDRLSVSDNARVQTRSGFGETLVDLHNMEMIVNAMTTMESPTSLEVTIESSIDEPVGNARISLRNWNTGEFEQIGQYTIAINEELYIVPDIAAASYIDQDGNIDLSIKHLVFVPFLAFQFESYIDWVDILVE